MIGRERERGTVFKLILWVCVYTNSTKVHFKSNGERYKKSMVERLYRRFFKKMRRGKKKKKNKKRETWILNLLTTAAAVNHPKSTAQWITLFLSVLLLGDLNVNFIASLKKSKVYGQWLSHQAVVMDSTVLTCHSEEDASLSLPLFFFFFPFPPLHWTSQSIFDVQVQHTQIHLQRGSERHQSASPIGQ